MGTPPPGQPAGRAQSWECSKQMFHINIPHSVSPGTGMDRADQPAGSFPNHCSYQVEQGIALFQTDNEVAVPSDSVPVQAGHCTQGGEAATASLGKVTSKRKMLQNVLDTKAKSCSAITALLLK